MGRPIYQTDYSIPGYPVRHLIGETYDDWETADQKSMDCSSDTRQNGLSFDPCPEEKAYLAAQKYIEEFIGGRHVLDLSGDEFIVLHQLYDKVDKLPSYCCNGWASISEDEPDMVCGFKCNEVFNRLFPLEDDHPTEEQKREAKKYLDALRLQNLALPNEVNWISISPQTK